MVRQDKIAYLITGFNSLGKEPLFPAESPMECLIRTILSQGTRDENRDMAMDRLITACSTWEVVSALNKSELAAIIKPAGLANRKADTIYSFLKWCEAEMGGFDLSPMCNWTTNRVMNSLMAIPGIGLKTAAVFLCFNLRRDVFPVDVHVHRILTRVGVTARKLNQNQVFNQVNSYIPFGKDFFLHCHLIEHGRHFCKKNPICNSCSFSNHCDYKLKKNEWAEG